MRLNLHFFRWTLRTRVIIAAVLWSVVGVVAFFCSSVGHQFTNWTHRQITAAAQKFDYSLKYSHIVWLNENHYTKNEEILNITKIQQGTSMSDLSLDDIRNKIEQLPWIRTAIIERLLPHTLIITIEEKTPIALWQNNRTYHPLDEHAQIINTTKKLPADLLLVVGPEAPKHLLPLLKDLEEVPEIYQYVRSAQWIGQRHWNLKLFKAENGLEVILPEKNIKEALHRLDDHNKREKLIKRQLAAIDLRTAGKVVLKPISAPTKKKGQKK